MEDPRRDNDNSPIAAMMVTSKSLPASNAASISLPKSESGSLTSSLASPSPDIKFMNSPSMFKSWYSVRVTLGTSMLWVEGEMSSSFLPVKIWGSQYCSVSQLLA